jgi:hypothetical protein
LQHLSALSLYIYEVYTVANGMSIGYL